jgi:hypothetical protein
MIGNLEHLNPLSVNTFYQSKVLATFLMTFLLFLIGSGILSAQDDLKSRVFKEYLIVSNFATAKENTTITGQEYIAAQYELFSRNTISEQDRILLYKSLFKASDMKGWSPELQTILLYRLVKSDTEPGTTPAYQLMEQGYSSFIERVNQIISNEFSFLNERLNEERKRLEEQGIYAEIELSEELKQSAMLEVYEKLKKEAGLDFIKYSISGN